MENKNPNEQLGGVVNAWADMQKRMWGDWSSLLQNLPGGSEGPVEAVKKGVAAASKGTNEAARMLMDRMTSSQGAMNRVMDFFFKSMKIVAPLSTFCSLYNLFLLPILDEEFLRALEHAMPPSGGMGMGMDRLLMALTGLGIRETILFPLVK